MKVSFNFTNEISLQCLWLSDFCGHVLTTENHLLGFNVRQLWVILGIWQATLLALLWEEIFLFASMDFFYFHRKVKTCLKDLNSEHHPTIVIGTLNIFFGKQK